MARPSFSTMALENKPAVPEISIKTVSSMPLGKTPGDIQKELAKFTPETDRLVKGQFKNIERPGDSLPLSVSFYKGQKLFQQTLHDGEILELPLSVAMHLNHACCYPVSSHLMDVNGKKFQGIGKWVYRYEFRPLDFN